MTPSRAFGRSARRLGPLFATGIAAALVLLLTAAGASAASYSIQAGNYQFIAPGGGSSLTIAIGDEVTWIGSGDPHTVTSGAPGALDNRFSDQPASAGFLMSGDTFTATFSSSGTFPYFCEVHPEEMSGVIRVVSAGSTTPVPTVRVTPAPTPRSPQPPTSVPTATATAQPGPSPSPTEAPSAKTEPSASSTAPGPSAPPRSTAPSGPDSSPTLRPTRTGGAAEDTTGPGILLVALLAGGLVVAIVIRSRRGTGSG
ncbi:MAG: plastocyanin/azurin family copper-binding protein [Chloroflexota bacterium]